MVFFEGRGRRVTLELYLLNLDPVAVDLSVEVMVPMIQVNSKMASCVL